MTELSLHILDIIQNSITAKASLVQIGIAEDLEADKYTISINDNGCGISDDMLPNVTDPYVTTRTTRKVGMGLPLLKLAAEQTEGNLVVISEKDKGTTITAVFGHSHLDRAPLGDIAGVITLMASANPDIDFIYRHAVGVNEYCLDTREIKQTLEEVSISEPGVRQYLKELITNNLEEIGLK